MGSRPPMMVCTRVLIPPAKKQVQMVLARSVLAGEGGDQKGSLRVSYR